jgi:hypothetical protein
MRASWRGRSAGYSLLEVVIAAFLFSVVVLGSIGLLVRSTRLSESTAGVVSEQTRVQELLSRLEQELSYANGGEAKTVLAADFASGATTSIQVESTVGFPDRGVLLIGRGTASEERVRYAALGDDTKSFLVLTRGDQCTEPAAHAAGDAVFWVGLAEPIELQEDPPPAAWDGLVQAAGAATFFRGDGAGFTFRVPTDPSGGTSYLSDGELQWGAVVGGEPTLDGWSALYFEPGALLSEPAAGADVNGDGDEADVFDVGSVRLRSWDAADPLAAPTDVGLVPAMVLQERCNWGGDLDGDGFADPLFLWDGAARSLQVRLFVVHASTTPPTVRVAETLIFLRNE